MTKTKEKDASLGLSTPEVSDTANVHVKLTKDGFPLRPQPVDDPLDPLNWTSFRKHSILAIVMALYFMFTYVTTTTVPTFPELQDHYVLTLDQVNWTVAIPALGLAVGPLVWSSIADILGRRTVFIAGTVVALASTIGAALVNNYSGYMATRFLQGFGVSPAATVGLAIINDIFFEHERGSKIGLWSLAIDTGLLFGPFIGGFVASAGFRWIQWHVAILLGVILVAELAFLPETLYPRDHMSGVEAARTTSAAAEKGVLGDAVDVRGSQLSRTTGLPFLNVMPVPGILHPKPWDSLVRYIKLWKFAVIPLAAMTYSFGWYWWVLTVITMIPVAYETFSAQSQGLLFLGLILGTLVSEIFCSGRLSDKLIIKLAKRNNNQREPEMRLWLVYPAAVLSAVGLIIWGVSVEKNYHWMVGQVGFFLFGAGIQMGTAAIPAYMVDCYPLRSMSVVTFFAVSLNFSAFVSPFFIAPWVDTAGFAWSFAGQALITLFACVPLLALLHVFGGRIREAAGEPDWVNPEYDHKLVE